MLKSAVKLSGRGTWIYADASSKRESVTQHILCAVCITMPSSSYHQGYHIIHISIFHVDFNSSKISSWSWGKEGLVGFARSNHFVSLVTFFTKSTFRSGLWPSFSVAVLKDCVFESIRSFLEKSVQIFFTVKTVEWWPEQMKFSFLLASWAVKFEWHKTLMRKVSLNDFFL